MAIQILAQLDTNLAALAGKQLPYVASLAINRTAIGARDAVRGNLPRRFTLRNSWTRGGIQARMSSKSSLMAQVVAPGYMAIQETGGERRPDAGRTLTAPVAAAQSGSVIPKGKRPRALLGSGRAFLIRMRDGDAGVFSRFGPKRGQIELLYWLSDRQEYSERFNFEADVQAHVRERFSTNFAAAFAEAVR